MSVKFDFKYLVIGGGSAGLTGTAFSSDLGVSVALIDERIGGDCTWSGCVPSKSFIHAAEEAKAKETPVDYKKVFKYVQTKIHQIYSLEVPEVWEKRGATVFLGKAEIIDEHTVKVVTEKEERILTTEYMLIATGAEPIVPTNIEGLLDSKYKDKVWTYVDFWEQEELPKSMAVIGAGPVGCEIAQGCSRLGCQVTMIASELLPKECEAGKKILEKVFQEEGIKHMSGRAIRVKQIESSELLEITTSNGEKVEVESILYAVGRAPVLPKGAERVFTVGEQGGLKVDKKLNCMLKNGEISNTVAAAGDCIDSNYQFSHYAGKQAYFTVQNTLLGGKYTGELQFQVPRATFTAPEIASIGFVSEKEALEAGFKDAVKLEIHGKHIDRCITEGAEDKTLFEVILSGTGTDATVIGANIIAPNAGEIIAPLCLAINTKTPIIHFPNVITPYPTYSYNLIHLVGKEATKRFVKEWATKHKE